ncbi:MAG: YaiI/YqxD family protein [Planctomycetaceae bacterium]
MRIYVDADACPVKDEIYKVAKRYSLPVTLVANAGMGAPKASWLELIIVKQGANVADDLIAEKSTGEDIVITADIPLASRCLDQGAVVIDHRGGEFTPENIGSILASREIGEQLRAAGIDTKGPRPLEKQARSQFLQKLDQVIQKRQRTR